MAGRNKQPLSVIEGKGRSKHITKKVAKERHEQEEAMKGFTDNIVAPSYLTKKQKDEFENISAELIRLNIFSNLDVDGLARYIDSRDQYIKLIKDLKKIKATITVKTDEGKSKTFANDDYPKLMRAKNTLFNECRAAASDLGLSITSRLKLVIPKTDADKKPQTEAEKRFGGRL
ncbi:phage terminase small subunit P27 family [Virgibacillus ndiopensis]|uniref:phage terminase small subunit P27 family n=1 Tax=Virgibacillus ndiopensis TaxID=2004408 RepID=UPI000C083AC7|nr:phage terminase small subunit P27 family [Virgibacillus ndiopensis]